MRKQWCPKSRDMLEPGTKEKRKCPAHEKPRPSLILICLNFSQLLGEVLSLLVKYEYHINVHIIHLGCYNFLFREVFQKRSKLSPTSGVA